MMQSVLKPKITLFNIKCLGYVFLFIMYIPAFVTRLVDIPHWGIICYVVILLSDMYFLYRMRYITKPIIYTTVFFGYFLLTTAIRNPSELFECLLRTYTAISMAILLEYIFKKNGSKGAIHILMCAMEFFNYANFLSMLVYPAGMFLVYSNGLQEEIVRLAPGAVRRTAARVLWLLGHQTMLIRFTLPAVCIAMVYCCLRTGKFRLNLRSALLIVVCLIETYIANSAGNFLMLFVFAAFLTLFHFRGRVKAQYIYPVIIIVYIFLVSTTGDMSIYALLSNLLNRSVQISTRVPIWLNAIGAWIQRPILGHGYLRDGADYIRQILTLGNPHSSYLWTLYEGGIVGMALMVAYFQIFAKRINGCWASSVAKIIYAAFITMLICMIDDDHVFRSQFYLIIFEMAYHIPNIVRSASFQLQED